MTALAIASGYWGGAGYILVPFDAKTGNPSTLFPEIVRAYDPDHVVTLSIPTVQWEEWYPGKIQIANVKDDAERIRLIRNSPTFGFEDWAAERARAIVASWCSPMRLDRMPQQRAQRAVEAVRSLAVPDRKQRSPGVMLPAPSAGPTSRLAAAVEWRSDEALFAAMRVGVAATEPNQRPEPTAAALPWLMRREDSAPTSLIWSNENITPVFSDGLESWFLADQNLLQVGRGYIDDRVTIVVGDTGEDFALALAYDRVLGAGIWLTPAQLDDKTTLSKHIQPFTWLTISEVEANADHVVLTSASATPAYLDDVSKRIRSPFVPVDLKVDGVSIPGGPDDRDGLQMRRPNIGEGRFSYAVNEHINVSVTLPVANLPDGSSEALMELETPIPSKLLAADNSGAVPYWFVDVTFNKDFSPSGRDLPGSASISSESAFAAVNIRSSNAGLSFDPRSMGYVPARALLTSRIGRPMLRRLSMQGWVEAMAGAEGLGVRLSSTGRQAELIRRRLGTRLDLFGLMTDGTLPMLREFVRRENVPEVRHPDTVVVGLDPYLSFEAIENILPGDDKDSMRVIDRLTSARLMRRGLVLDCLECGRPSFVDADRLGQRYECLQCGASNTLESARWRAKTPEPRWFYDLYATFRELLHGRGDVVLLAAANLQRSTNTYTDTPELEFYDLTTEKPVAEIDVIAKVGSDVVLVEAKAGASFGGVKHREEQTEKLVRIATVLRADRIQLATDRDKWTQADVTYLTKESAKVSPFPVSVDVATGLA